MTADDITTAVNPEPAEATQTADPTVPQPECVSCHGQGSPDGMTVQEAVQFAQDMVDGHELFDDEKQAIRIVLAALENHHQ